MSCIYTPLACKCYIYLRWSQIYLRRLFCRFSRNIYLCLRDSYTLKTKLQLCRELTSTSSFNENHQRCQGARQQHDTTDTRSRASVAVVTITTADVTFKRTKVTFAGRVVVLGTPKTESAIFREHLGCAGFKVHLGTSIRTSHAFCTCFFTIIPWRSRTTVITLQTQSWRLENNNISINQSIKKRTDKRTSKQNAGTAKILY